MFNIWDIHLIQGFLIGFEISWQGDLIGKDWGINIDLGFVHIGFIKCYDHKNLEEYGYDVDLPDV